jgi:diguanylate cyclase (GGDEF)-like protein
MDGESFTVWGPPDGFPDTVHNILEARDGTVWIATNGGGLVRFRGGRFKTYTTRDGLSSDIVNVVHEDAAGTIWVGTFGGGLNRMKGEGFVAYTTSEGLFDDAIFSILEDDQERLWMSCNKGIFRVDKRELEKLDARAIPRLDPVVFGVEDGMKNRECNGANQPPATQDAEGRFWFPTIEGVVRIDPRHLPQDPAPPAVTIEQLLVDGRPVSPVAGLVLPAGRRNLEFHFAAPHFVSPGRVHYRYKLEGLDPDWVEAGPRRDAYYSRLPSGQFTFRVAAVNGDGVSSPAETVFSFRLEPRLVERPWFFGLCAAAVGGVLLVGDRVRVRAVKARERSLQLLVEERTRELAEANARLERLSSLDGLTGVANRRRFDEVMDQEWRRAARANTPLSLIMLDLDFFKAYNDTNGHLAGDERLRQVAQALVSAVGRAGDLVARYGGEEFVVLLPGMPQGDAAALAERLRAGVEALGLSHNASTVSRVVTLTAGVATMVPKERTSPAALLAAADGALYRAKGEGRNRVAVAAG